MNIYSYNLNVRNKGSDILKLLNDDKIIDLSELFKIFGDSTRVKIINVLINGEMSVNLISEKIGASQSAVSHQLRILKDSKLVKYRKEGNLTYYFLADDHVEKIFVMGCEHINEI